MQSEFNKAVSRAKIHLMEINNTMFLATVCCALQTIESDEVHFAATNGVSILINPTAFMQLSPDERIFLIAHETFHCIYKHMTRRGNRDPEMWNHAADYVINSQLIQQGFTMIKGGLHNPDFDGKSADEIYTILEQQKEKGISLPSNVLDGDIQEPSNGSGSSTDSNGNDIGDVDQVSSQGSPTKDEVENAIDDIIISAAQLCEMRGEPGSIPGEIKRYLDSLVKPKVNWKVILRRFLHELDKSDYSWARPNKRYQDFYLPHMRGQATSQISFAIDTSGSVSKDEFTQFISEVSGVMKTLKPKVLHLMQFDHRLQYSGMIKNLRELSKVPFKGHGGTDPSVAIEEFRTSKSKALIMLTDGCFYTERLVNPKRPVVWIIFNNPNFTAPFGKAIHIEL